MESSTCVPSEGDLDGAGATQGSAEGKPSSNVFLRESRPSYQDKDRQSVLPLHFAPDPAPGVSAPVVAIVFVLQHDVLAKSYHSWGQKPLTSLRFMQFLAPNNVPLVAAILVLEVVSAEQALTLLGPARPSQSPRAQLNNTICRHDDGLKG